MPEVFTITSAALPATAQLAGFHGTEGISRLYRYDIFLLMVDDVAHDFDVRAAVGAKATLRHDRADGTPSFLVHGVIASIELVSDFNARSVFRAVLVPSLWHLTRSLHSRIFTQRSVKEILQLVLDAAGLAHAYTLSLLGSDAKEEFVCQYNESDFDFISRWMEREGLYSYFDQGDDAERLIITDARSTQSAASHQAIRYFPQDNNATTPNAFRSFTCRYHSLPASVRLKDYDYTRPNLDVSGQAAVSAAGVAQVYIHGSRFLTPDAGAHLAQVRAQSLLAGEAVFHGIGHAPHLRTGFFFELTDHPRTAFNTNYLATELQHWVKQLPGVPELDQMITWSDTYRVEATAIVSTVQYRAPQVTPWPRIYGTEHAVVDGPAVSDYAQVDSMGRYKVKFFFDESTLTAGDASAWVRMLQPHGGSPEGFHFPLRAGTEVMCTFLGGDPDRPSIVAVAPNAVTPSPVTSANNTRNVLQTGGRNRLEIEDLAGHERVTLSTPNLNTYHLMGAPENNHSHVLTTDGSMSIHTGQDLDITVDRSATETATVTKLEKVGNKTVPDDFPTSDATSAFTGDEVCRQVVFGDAKLYVSGSYSTHYHGDHDSKKHGDYTSYLKGSSNSTTDGSTISTVNGASTSTVNGTSTSIVNGARVSNTLLASVSHVLGFNFSFVEGISIGNVLGGSVSATEIFALNAVLGLRLNLTKGWQYSFNWGGTNQMTTGVAFSNLLGGKVDLIEGFKIEVNQGFEAKRTVVAIQKRVANMTAAQIQTASSQIATVQANCHISLTDLAAIF